MLCILNKSQSKKRWGKGKKEKRNEKKRVFERKSVETKVGKIEIKRERRKRKWKRREKRTEN